MACAQCCVLSACAEQTNGPAYVCTVVLTEGVRPALGPSSTRPIPVLDGVSARPASMGQGRVRWESGLLVVGKCHSWVHTRLLAAGPRDLLG